MYSILAVDDEPINLQLIEAFLDDKMFKVDTAVDGLDAWHKINVPENKYDLILLDRMMPNMNGMELIAKIKTKESLKNIPIIMQTASAMQAQVDEGMRAGVFYYLAKPFDEETLNEIINTCLEDYAQKEKLAAVVRVRKNMVGIITNCKLKFQNLSEANDAATYLATLFPNPESKVMGISELLINAVEHGNLGITYEQKTHLHKEKNWNSEITRLLELPENKEKYVEVDYFIEDDNINLIIKDQGKGFNWRKYLELSPERAVDSHGRGIAMANALSFDSLEYIGCGNEVKCKVNLTT